MNLEEVLRVSVEAGASDTLLIVGKPPITRVHTQLQIIEDMQAVDVDSIMQLLKPVLDEKMFRRLEETRDIDFSMTIPSGTRFRVNVHYQNGVLAMALRTIKASAPSIDELGLPKVLKDLADLPRGLVLVTGPTGSGKSTTLASMIEQINTNKSEHIITLEDPVEYQLQSRSSIIEQREIGSDCPNFASGLRHALRQDPDVILVGEMRDLETTEATITAAETGHLVFSTLHTVSAAQTIERVIDIYPASQQGLIRTMLANTLQAVISQTLFQRSDRPGVVACNEIMICTTAIRNCIREDKIYEIPSIIETGRRFGMQTLDQGILEIATKGIIDVDQALERCTDRARMQRSLVEKGVAREPVLAGQA